MAKEKVVTVASMNPDEFSGGGRPDDFVGVIGEPTYQAYKWANSKSGKYMLFAMVPITPDEESGYEPFIEPLQAGWLNEGVPSTNGKTPSGGSWEDYAALGNGESEIEEGDEGKYSGEFALGRVPKNTDWHQFNVSLNELGFKEWTNSIKCISGVRAHFNRIPAKKQTKKAGPDEQQWKVLVATELLPSKGGKKQAGAAKAAQAETNGSVDLDPTLVANIKKVVVDAGGELTKNKMIASVVKLYETKDKAGVMKKTGDETILAGLVEHGILFDTESKVLTVVE